MLSRLEGAFLAALRLCDNAWRRMRKLALPLHSQKARKMMIDALQHLIEQVEQLDPALQATLVKRFQEIVKEELAAEASDKAHKGRSIQDLGWSEEEAREVRASLQTFEEDWNAPGMDAYDEL